MPFAKKSLLVLGLLLALCFLWGTGRTAAESVVPLDSAMGRAGSSLQQQLLSPLTDSIGVGKAGWKMDNLSAASQPSPAKIGDIALRLSGEAEAAGAKGDFTLTGDVPGVCKFLGMWVFLPPGANVESLGFQMVDAKGETRLFRVPADWASWKWIETDLKGAAPSSIHAVWFAKAAGPSSLTVNALVAATEPSEPSAWLTAQNYGAAWGETNMPMPAQQIVLTNFGPAARGVKITYQVQHDPALFSDAPPDPVYGADRALGAKSWTEAEGKTIEQGSLTDGKRWTGASLGWGSHTEAFQYVDLGQERLISHLTYDAGDANWAWKVDVSASPDGKTWQPVPGLQNIDLHGKWGTNIIPVPQPFRARFLRLRHHNGGQAVNQIFMPSTLSVYDGAANETWELPHVGEIVAQGALSQTIPARSFGTATITGGKPLAPGVYLLAARVRDGDRTQLIYQHFMVMPAPLPSVVNSRFGLNTSNYLLAPLHRRLGVGWVRFENMKWPMTSPQPNVYDFHGVAPWNLNHDEIVHAFHAQGINVLPFLFQTPEYATSAPSSVTKNRESYPPKDNAQMAEFVFQTVARYGAQRHPAGELQTADKISGLNEINTFEIWNEPNLNDPGWGPWVGTSAQYNEMFRAAAEAAKRADPSARITNGGFAGIDVGTLNALLLPYADGKKPLDFVDVLNVHYYSGRVAPEIATVDSNADRTGNGKQARTFEDDLHRLVAWRDKNKPGLPIWMSETGYDSAGPSGTDERTQAAQLPRVVMMALAAGVEKVIVYRDTGSTPSLFAASGVLRDDESLKPSWFTYATLIRELDGVQTGAIRLPYPDPHVRLYAWTRGTETILSAWTIEGAANLDLKLGPCTVTDAFGSARTENIASKLPLSIFPTYIKNIGNLAGLKVLTEQARHDKAAHKAEQARLATRRAYLFAFGSKTTAGTLDLGDTRAFTPVIGQDVYDDAKGYGFFSKPAGQDNDQHWIDDPLERHSTRMNPDQSFRFRARLGRYQLQVSISPQSAGQLVLKGAVGGDQTFPIVKDGPVVTADVQVGADPLTLSNTAYGDIHWLSLVEKP